MFEFLMLFAFFALFFFLMFALICIPITIANNRNLNKSEKTIIIILSWLGILFGVTWVIALVLALVWNGDTYANIGNLEKLEKVAKLYKDKVISKAEYEAMKASLLK